MIESVGKERLRALLSAEGAAPRRRHGQNFLLDENLLAAIARSPELQPGDRVLEIGPGPGLLTRHLLDQGFAVTALEIDPAMGRVARHVLGERWDEVRWIEADALDGPRRLGPELAACLPDVRGLVANLPYNAAGGILGGLLAHDALPERLVVLIQKEMGDRFRARPGSRQWGSLAVQSQLNAPPRLLRKVPPQAFWPAPKVDSVVLRFDRLAERPSSDERRNLARFLSLAFHNRRKTLVNSIGEAVDAPAEAVLASLAGECFQQKIRAEALDEVQLCELAQTWAVSALGERHRP